MLDICKHTLTNQIRLCKDSGNLARPKNTTLTLRIEVHLSALHASSYLCKQASHTHTHSNKQTESCKAKKAFSAMLLGGTEAFGLMAGKSLRWSKSSPTQSSPPTNSSKPQRLKFVEPTCAARPHCPRQGPRASATKVEATSRSTRSPSATRWTGSVHRCRSTSWLTSGRMQKLLGTKTTADKASTAISAK